MSKAIFTALLLALVGAIGVQTVRLSQEQLAFAQYKAAQAEAARTAEAHERIKERTRQNAINKITLEAQSEIDQAKSDAVAARTSAERLQQHVKVLVVAGRASAVADAAVGGTGEQGGDALDLLAGLFARADGAAGELAEFADRLRVAGLACEKSFAVSNQ